MENKTEIKFEELSPEVQAYIDRERSRASQTAYANAEKKLKSDNDFISSIRSAIEEEAKLSGEEKLAKERETLQAEMKQFRMDQNKFAAKSKLLEAGMNNEQVEKFTSFLVAEDAETTTNRVNEFLETYKTTFEDQLAQAKKQLLKETPTPQTGGSVSDEAHYKAEFKKATDSGDMQYMARVIREAATKNITLN